MKGYNPYQEIKKIYDSLSDKCSTGSQKESYVTVKKPDR